MFKNIKFVVVFCVFMKPVYASMVVIDPEAINAINLTGGTLNKTMKKSAYERYTQMGNQTAQLKQSVATGRALFENAENQLKAMTENLQRGVGFERISESLADLIMQDKPAFVSLKSEITKKPLDITKAEDVDQLIDQHFPPMNKANRKSYRKRSSAYHQQAQKSALKVAELTINNADKRRREVEHEVQKINTTQSVKDSQDLNNRLVGEMLLELQKTNILLAQLARAQSTSQFRGIRPDTEVSTMTDRERARAGNIVPQSSYYNKKTPSGKTFMTLEEALQQKRRSW